jgi:hypothetical protein
VETHLELARQCLTLAGTPFTEEALTGGWTKLRIQNSPGLNKRLAVCQMEK